MRHDGASISTGMQFKYLDSDVAENTDVKGKGRMTERDEGDLTIKHDLRLGPKEHGLDPEGENEWLFYEPNAGIRLT
jgi:hypothetical protein